MAVLDTEVLDRLRADIGDETVCELIEMFVSDTDGLVDQFDQSVLHGDRETLRRSAHTLKSTALVLGAIDLSSACGRLEDASTDSTPDKDLQGMITTAVKKSAVAKKALARELAELRKA